MTSTGAFECGICLKTFTRSTILKTHLNRHARNKPFTCAICAKEFVSRDELRSHEVTHSAERRFQCPECEYTSHRSCTLRRHQNRRHGRIPTKRANQIVSHIASASQSQNLISTRPTIELSAQVRPGPPKHRISKALKGRNSASWSRMLNRGPFESQWYDSAWMIAVDLRHRQAIKDICNLDISRLNALSFHSPHYTRLDKISALHVLVSKNDVETVLILLDLGADINLQSARLLDTPLMYATHCNFPRCIEILMNNGALVNMINARGETALLLARARLSTICLRFFLLKGVNLLHKDFAGNTVLHMHEGQFTKEQIALLLDHDIDVDARNENGQTPLMILASKPHLDSREIFIMLIQHGANVPGRDNTGQTALHKVFATFQETESLRSVVSLLLEYHADVNAQDHEGQTILHIAVKRSVYRTIKILAAPLPYLISIGMNINAQDNTGRTGVHYVALDHFSNFRRIELLIENGALINLRDNSGNTPLVYALKEMFARNEDIDLIERTTLSLIRHGATIDEANDAGETARSLYSKRNIDLDGLIKFL